MVDRRGTQKYMYLQPKLDSMNLNQLQHLSRFAKLQVRYHLEEKLGERPRTQYHIQKVPVDSPSVRLCSRFTMLQERHNMANKRGTHLVTHPWLQPTLDHMDLLSIQLLPRLSKLQVRYNIPEARQTRLEISLYLPLTPVPVDSLSTRLLSRFQKLQVRYTIPDLRQTRLETHTCHLPVHSLLIRLPLRFS